MSCGFFNFLRRLQALHRSRSWGASFEELSLQFVTFDAAAWHSWDHPQVAAKRKWHQELLTALADVIWELGRLELLGNLQLREYRARLNALLYLLRLDKAVVIRPGLKESVPEIASRTAREAR